MLPLIFSKIQKQNKIQKNGVVKNYFTRPFFCILFCFLFLLSTEKIFANEIYEPFQSIRQLGMGGVYVFNEHDANSFLQNPAYTCHLKGLNWTLVDVGAGLGDLTNYSTLATQSTATGLTSFSAYYGKSIWIQAGGISTLTLPCFGMSGYYTGIAGFKLHNPAFPSLVSMYQTDYGLAIGGGFPLAEDFSLGLSAKRVIRKGGPYTFGPDSISTLTSAAGVQDLVTSTNNEGIGYGIDMGFAARLKQLPFNPTVSLAWRDVGSTAFVKTNGLTSPERQKDNLVAGVTFDGSIPLLGIAAGLEYRHINDNSEPLGKKLHAGAELTFLFMDLRAGLYQGYPTYGFGMNMWLVQLDASVYTIETGAYPGQTANQRAQIGLNMELEFDPNFKLVGSGGQRRRLKQRR
jgi:hypothetical protein